MAEMDAQECIKTRRSIRKYKENIHVPASLTETLIEAAMYAPSARNMRSWQFIIIDRRELLEKLAVIHPYGKMLAGASIAILVCGDLQIETEEAYNVINCAAATQNILLAAHANGLGAVWLGVYPRKDRMKGITDFFNLPANVMPVSLISIGYPAEEKETPDRVEKEKIHLNGW